MFVTELFKHLTYRVFAPGALLRARYDSFKRLLGLDRECLELIADLEEIAYGAAVVDQARADKLRLDLSARTASLCETLVAMNPARYVGLSEYHRKIDFYLALGMSLPDPDTAPPYVLPLTGCEGRTGEAGGKAANLGRAMRLLESCDDCAAMTPGFVVTTRACEYLVEYAGLRPTMNDLLARIRLDKREGMFHICRELENMILNAEVPPAVEDALRSALDGLLSSLPGRGKPLLAVRSSAVGEDSDASFAGQYLSQLNVEPDNVLDAYKRVVASKYSSRAVTYRILRGFADQENQMAVIVMPMIPAASAGVLYTREPAGIGRDMVVYAVPGLGSSLVEGEVCPDEMRFEPDPPHVFISRKPACPGRSVKSMRPSEAPVVDEESARTLVRAGAHLRSALGYDLDIEWAVDARPRAHILQARPLNPGRELGGESCPVCIVTTPEADADRSEAPAQPDRGEPLIDRGEVASAGIAAGPVWIVDNPASPGDVPKGAVVVVRTLSPELIRVMPRARAVLAERGSRASHFASVAREFGVPVLIPDGPANREALRNLRNGELVHVDCFAAKVHRALPEDIAVEAELPVPVQGPLGRRLRAVIPVISKLNLTNPDSPDFTPTACRSMHDLVRFCHESAVREMFTLAGRGVVGAGARRLNSGLPLLASVLDVDEGLMPDAVGKDEITPDMVACAPFKALWRGLSDPKVGWDPGRPHFDWARLAEVGQGDGFISTDASDLGSYAVIGKDYMHFLIRFGFHFAVADALCSENAGHNYINFRFKGGGGQPYKRLLRLEFIRAVLEPLGFKIKTRGDMLDAAYSRNSREASLARLAGLGFVLGVTRVMDVALRDEEDARRAADKCLNVIRSLSILLGMDE